MLPSMLSSLAADSGPLSRTGFDSSAPLPAPEVSAIPNASSALSQPLTVDYQPPKLVPSVLDGIPSYRAKLITKIAEQKKSQSSGGDLLNSALMGVSPEELDAKRNITAAQEAAAKLSQQLSSLDDSQFNEVLGHLQGLIQQRNPLPTQPALQAPSMEQGILAGVGALLDPRHAGQIVSAPFNDQQQARDQQYQQDLATYQATERARAQDIGATEQMLSMVNTRQNQQAARLNQEFDNQLQVIRFAQGNLDRIEQRNQQRYLGLMKAYESAKGLDQMKSIRAQMSAIDGVQYPDDLIQSDWETKTIQARGKGVDQWERTLKNTLNEFGEIPEDQRAAMETQRAEIARAYGISPDMLRTVPTGETLKKTYQTQRMDLATKQLGRQLKADEQRHVDRMAELDLAGKRFLEAVNHNRTVESQGAQRISLSAQALSMRAQLKGGFVTQDKYIDGKLAPIQEKIMRVQAQLSANPKDKQAAKALAGLQAEYSYWAGQKDEVRSAFEGLLGLDGVFQGLPKDPRVEALPATAPQPQQFNPTAPAVPIITGPIGGSVPKPKKQAPKPKKSNSGPPQGWSMQ